MFGNVTYLQYYNIATKGRRDTPAIFNENYPGFSNICKWAIIADTVSENKNWFIAMVLLTQKFKNKQLLQKKLCSTINIYRDIFSNIHPRSVLT